MNRFTSNQILDEEVQRYRCASVPKAFDLETTGLHPHLDSKLFSFSFTDQEHKTRILRVDTPERFKNHKEAKDILESDTPIVGHNILFDLSFLGKANIYAPKDKVIHDTMRMHQLLRNDFKRHSLDYLGHVYGGFSRELDSQVKKLGKSYGGYHKIPVAIMDEYQELDTYRTMLLFQMLYPELQKEEGLFKLYVNEMLIIKMAVDMQKEGLQTSHENITNLMQEIKDEIESIQEQVNTLYGKYYDLNKPDICRYLLYDVLKLPVTKLTKKGQTPSTDKDVLLSARKKYFIEGENPKDYKLLDLIVKYRSYKHGIQELDKYHSLLDENMILHTSLKPCTAQTGRWGAENPNLLNVQKDKTNDLMPYPIPARKCFTAKKGSFIVAPDYSGEELRLIAEVTQEEAMLDIFARDGDPHTEVAEFLFEDRFKDGSKEEKSGMRAIAKNFNFALAYGASDQKLSNTLLIPIGRIITLRAKYAEKFPKIAVYSRSIAWQIKQQGYVVTPFGRRLYCNPVKAFQGGNYLIQGTGVDILKYAMVRINEYSKYRWDGQIKPILPIHDELMMSIPVPLWDQRDIWMPEIDRCMTEFEEIKVKLVVGWKYTFENWNEMIEI